MVLRWGILGAGDIADRGMAPALNRAADTRLEAVYCRTMEKAQAFAARHGAAKAYDSIDKMLADPAIDAVYIATPNSLHAEHTKTVARGGKHVLVEKPMANTVRDAEAMVEACERAGVTLGVVFQNRYHHAHFEARRYVQSGALGEVELATATLCRGRARGASWKGGWRVDPAMAGSGAIVAQAVHPIDLLRFILGAEVREVQAMIDENSPQIPVEEMSYTLLEFDNGTRGIVVAGTLIPRFDNDVLLYGTKAKFKCTATLGTPHEGSRPEMTVQGDGIDERIELESGNSNPEKMARMVEEFSRSVRDGTQPALSGENGIQMVRIALAIQRSGRERRAVTVPEA